MRKIRTLSFPAGYLRQQAIRNLPQCPHGLSWQLQFNMAHSSTTSQNTTGLHYAGDSYRIPHVLLKLGENTSQRSQWQASKMHNLPLGLA